MWSVTSLSVGGTRKLLLFLGLDLVGQGGFEPPTT